jgi:hypothetical protein
MDNLSRLPKKIAHSLETPRAAASAIRSLAKLPDAGDLGPKTRAAYADYVRCGERLQAASACVINCAKEEMSEALDFWPVSDVVKAWLSHEEVTHG